MASKGELLLRVLVVLGAVLGGVAVWRRKTLKEDAAKVSDAAKGGVDRIKGGSSDAADAMAEVAEEAAEVAEEAAETASDAADAVSEAASDAAGT